MYSCVALRVFRPRRPLDATKARCFSPTSYPDSEIYTTEYEYVQQNGLDRLRTVDGKEQMARGARLGRAGGVAAPR